MFSIFDCFGNEQPMDSALNSAHFHSRRAENHLNYGRYDDAIESHKETVNFLTKAITESTIPKNIEHLKLQRNHHENIQQVIKRQKREFEDFLLQNGLKLLAKQPKIVKDANIQKTFPEDIVTENSSPPSDTSDAKQDIIDENEFFSICKTDLKENVNDDDKFFSMVAELKIDKDAYIDTFLDVAVINENNDSDNEEYYLSF